MVCVVIGVGELGVNYLSDVWWDGMVVEGGGGQRRGGDEDI